MFEIKKIGILSLGRTMAIISALLGLLMGVFYMGYFLLLGGFFFGRPPIYMMLLPLIILPVIYAVIGFIMWAIIGFVYNLIAPKIGGIEIELERKNE